MQRDLVYHTSGFWIYVVQHDDVPCYYHPMYNTVLCFIIKSREPDPQVTQLSVFREARSRSP